MLATRDRRYLVGQIAADPREFIEVLALSQHVGDTARQLSNQPRRPPVGAHAELVGTLDVEKIGNLVELAGNLGVDDGHGAVWMSGRLRPAAGCCLDLDQQRPRNIGLCCGARDPWANRVCC